MITKLGSMYGIVILLLAVPFLICGLVVGDKWLKKQIMIDCREKLEFIDSIFDILEIEQLRREALHLNPELYEKLCRLRNDFFHEKQEIITSHLRSYNNFGDRYRYLLYKNTLYKDAIKLENDMKKFRDIREELMKILFESKRGK